MSTQMYQYKNQFLTMTEQEVKDIISAAEKTLRTGTFSYVDQQAFQAQIADFKTNWPTEAQAYIKIEAKKLAAGSNVTHDMVAKAMLSTCKEFVAGQRAAKNNSSPMNEFGYMSGDIALSTLFRRAPDASIDALPRKWSPMNSDQNGRLIKVKASANSKRLVVDEEKIDEADIYVQALYVKAFQKSILIGWATKADMKAASKSSKTTDETCNWTRPAYHLPIERIRPMAEFLKEFAITEVSTGILFERIPKLTEIPMIASEEAQWMLKPAKTKDTGNYDDFLRSCGFDIEPVKSEGMEL